MLAYFMQAYISVIASHSLNILRHTLFASPSTLMLLPTIALLGPYLEYAAHV